MTIEFSSTLTGVAVADDILMVGFTDGEPLGDHVVGLQRRLPTSRRAITEADCDPEYLEWRSVKPLVAWGGYDAVRTASLERAVMAVTLTENASHALEGIDAFVVRFNLEPQSFEELKEALRQVFRGSSKYSERM